MDATSTKTGKVHVAQLDDVQERLLLHESATAVL